MTKGKPTKQRLLENGLKVLTEEGPSGLTIDAICVRVKVTKGAFYHHFRSRSGYHAALLEYWMEEYTERRKQLADEKGTPEERYARIVEYAATLPHDLEKAIRAWAMRDPFAAKYQAKADESRHAYLTGLLRELLKDDEQAEAMAMLVLSTMVGMRHLFPPVAGEERRAIMSRLHELMGLGFIADIKTDQEE